MSDVSITDLIAEARAWRSESPDDPNTEEVSERVTMLIARLADALESVTAQKELDPFEVLRQLRELERQEAVTVPTESERESLEKAIEQGWGAGEQEADIASETGHSAFEGKSLNTIPPRRAAEAVLARGFRFPVTVEPEQIREGGTQ